MAAPLLTHAPDEHSGRKLGKYEILCRLSTGGMSEIFLAFQRGLAGFRKYVVLKQILPDIKGEEEFVRMFLDEARITAAFNHPNIAQVFDLDIQDGELFLAMEFVPGATLVEVARATRQRNEAIPIGFTLQAVRDTALALHYAHTFTDPLGRPQTVIHRDVAEKNIMVTYEGVTKLLDFGIAKALGHSSRTSVGMVKGTSGYMSPEQILGEPLDARSDIFALGVVLHECLTGMRLFHGRTPEEAMMQALKGEVLPPSAQNAALPPELDQVTLKALQRRRDDRYATALELARAIERAAGPHIWHPEQSGEFVTRLFAQRRDATRKLMSEAQAMASELTGDFQLAKLLGNEPPAEPPPQRARSAPPSKAPPPEPKTIATQRREPPSVEEPPPPPPKAPERAPPRK
ncbi:MAG: serine/threonine protein kinase, partial [Myxococcaceae bacterium]|nr:serine/threonine protein kinase [Myxococcaceae bacterium]